MDAEATSTGRAPVTSYVCLCCGHRFEVLGVGQFETACPDCCGVALKDIRGEEQWI